MIVCGTPSTEAGIGSPSWQVGNSQHRGSREPRCGGGAGRHAGLAFCTCATEEGLR